jgi:hypothetical protein
MAATRLELSRVSVRMCNSIFRASLLLLAAVVLVTATLSRPAPPIELPLEFVKVAAGGREFCLSDSQTKFVPWGFNYDHDGNMRLLESYWIDEWDTVVEDFEEMKQLGANTVRIHLQLPRFMKSNSEPNPKSLEQLARLVQLAEKTRLYLIVTGLGCYDPNDRTEEYDALDERERWNVQSTFWEAVAKVCRDSPAVFCYDLMNEPIVTEENESRDWTPGEFGGYSYVQRLTLDLGGRGQREVAAAWVDHLVKAIRKHDKRHLVTVGAIPWAMTFKGAKPVIYSAEAIANLDFVSLHIYPKKDEVANALEALTIYDIGKPIVIEEMFPLACSVAELDEFIDGSQPLACGWIGFYWGKSIEEYRVGPPGIAEALARDWLEYFVRKTPEMVGVPLPRPAENLEIRPE